MPFVFTDLGVLQLANVLRLSIIPDLDFQMGTVNDGPIEDIYPEKDIILFLLSGKTSETTYGIIKSPKVLKLLAKAIRVMKKQTGLTTQKEIKGNFETANKDFNELEPQNVKPIETQYRPGRADT